MRGKEGDTIVVVVLNLGRHTRVRWRMSVVNRLPLGLELTLSTLKVGFLSRFCSLILWNPRLEGENAMAPLKGEVDMRERE